MLLGFYITIAKPILAARGLNQNYGLLELNTTREDADTLFGKPPGLIVHFSERDVLYYGADSLASSVSPQKKLEPFKDLEIEYVNDLPWVYGFVQVLVDSKSGKILAKTMNGETSRVNTTLGAFGGSSLDKLPSEIQMQLFGFEQEKGWIEYVEE